MKTITIAGNIGKDAELRSTQGGDKVAGFSVAVESREGKEKTTIWFDVSIWGKRAEALSQYLTKGTRVAVSGDLGKREYEGKTYLTVKADQVTLLGGGQRDDSGYDRGSSSNPNAADAHGGYGAGAGPNSGGDMEEEIPFAAEWRA
jgi:single-strand DNA-binding protein